MNLREELLEKNVFNLVKTCEPIQNRQCQVSQFAVSTGIQNGSSKFNMNATLVRLNEF